MQLTAADSSIANADNRIIWLYYRRPRLPLDANVAGPMEDNGVHFHIINEEKRNRESLWIYDEPLHGNMYPGQGLPFPVG